jgi:hypothetical protein
MKTASAVRREARIYALYALVSAALAIYLAYVVTNAWSQYGFSATFAVYASMMVLFLGFSLFGAVISITFAARSVSSIRHVPGGFELILNRGSSGAAVRAVQASRVRHLRTIGRQFSENEAAPAFSFFWAAGQVWVAEAGIYHAHAGGTESAA